MVDSSATVTSQSQNQTLSGSTNQSETLHSESSNSGNDVTGLFTSRTESTGSVTILDQETNTDQDIHSTHSNERMTIVTASGNAVTGDYSQMVTTSDTTSLDQDGNDRHTQLWAK